MKPFWKERCSSHLAMLSSHSDRNWVFGQSVLMLAVVILGVTQRGAWH